MKRIFLIFSIVASSTVVFAQGNCSNGDPFFTFDNDARAMEIHTLGSNPEFPFIRNMSTPQQVYAAIKRNENKGNYKARMQEFDRLMVSIGFANGIKDLQASSITTANVPSGSEGNMGNGNLGEGYYKLTGDPSGYKAWKITSGTGCYVYVLAACGNAFYPNPHLNEKKTACINAPVNITSTPREITVNANPVAQVKDKTYIYYHLKKHRAGRNFTRAGIPDDNPSKPLLLSTKKRVESRPETYKLSVASQTGNVTVCPDKPVDVATDINVEQISSFTGNYPGASRTGYREVSKKTYRKAERKVSKIEKKEAKVAALTGVAVDLEE